MYYAIECLATTGSQEKLYVTDSYPELTGTTKQGGQFRSSQLWQALYNPNSGGVSLRNKESGNLIAVPAGNNPALLVPNTIENQNKLPDPSAVLNIVGNDPEGYRIVRGLQDQDNNLDLAGNLPYADGVRILFWTWQNDANYKWKFIDVEA
ncbi:hypothetical protein HNR00_000943 [Methylorubrum rhodinum]|uniref:Ricin B lectin domain-containing protein n=1 Tax=Methylorubrum rhodinum TaxID=29428 RepID=A0A840ZGE3_9HYPH|nr:hypothetical protein [Methylorubrum rhodinum]MBB5756245.1 hypothetical protein [Methylorubrum rhodinum]